MKKPCPFCTIDVEMISVKGHGQCSVCKKIVDECCRGETTVLTTEQVRKKDAYRKAEGLRELFLAWGHTNSLIEDAVKHVKKKEGPSDAPS